MDVFFIISGNASHGPNIYTITDLVMVCSETERTAFAGLASFL